MKGKDALLSVLKNNPRIHIAENRLEIKCPVSLFPSDNRIEKGKLQDRINLKNDIKREADILIREWIRKHKPKRFPVFEKAEVVLSVYYENMRVRDIHNISLKTFLDCVVARKIIEDDSIRFIPKTTFIYGGLVSFESYAVFEMRGI